jgi:hypothetical protein
MKVCEGWEYESAKRCSELLNSPLLERNSCLLRVEPRNTCRERAIGLGDHKGIFYSCRHTKTREPRLWARRRTLSDPNVDKETIP